MKTINPADLRFIKITDCKIRGLYKELPYGGYLLQISYKNKAEDLFSQHQDIHIDQSKFLQEIAEYKPRKSKCKELTRLIYTYGMTDIDFYIQEKQLVIYYSIHDGSYVHFHFDAEEWKTLQNKAKMGLELEINN